MVVGKPNARNELSLRNCDLKYEYRSDTSNIVDEFYVPCLSESVEYRRAVGYFTSNGLILAAKGLARFVANGGKMFLVASPLFDAEDIEALNKGYQARKSVVERAILRQLADESLLRSSKIAANRLSCLAWLISENRLEVKVALPNHLKSVKEIGIYHEKVGLFVDKENNIVAFSGSANETVGGLVSNFEALDVFVSWDDSHERVARKVENFHRLWSDTTTGLTLMEFPEAARDKILRFRTRVQPHEDPESHLRRHFMIQEKTQSEVRSMYKTFLAQHIKQIKKQNFPQGCVLVYKGFPTDFVMAVGNEFSFLSDKGKLFAQKKIDLNAIVDNSKELVKKLMNVKDGVHVATYEELIAITTHARLSLFEPQIQIFNNNLFEQFPNQSTSKLPNVDQIVEKDQVDYVEDSLMNRFYVYSEERFGISLLQYRDIDLSDCGNVTSIDFFNREKLESGKIPFPLLEGDKIPVDAIPASDQDQKYFSLKYALFDHIENGNKKFCVISDTISLNTNRKLLSELVLLKEIYSQNGYVFDVRLRSGKPGIVPRKEFDRILKQYWKSDQFRDLLFYANPESDSEKYTVKQNALIEEVVTQVERARKNEFFSDIFITSPTGSGKSVLFQIPGIYLHQKYQLVTIIVSPLKALMYDQVTSLKNRGISFAAYIDSDITLIEREKIVQGIKQGNISILYLSPELLLSYDVRQFIGDRQLGLLVIDEAHLVTTWGRDFRVDYWYLGTYIKRLRKYMKDAHSGSTMEFPVVGLTATAVFSGPDDIVYETVSSLNMQAPNLYIGNVRRDSIEFKIRPFVVKKTHEDEKLSKTTAVVKHNVDSLRKTIVYCPWVRQVKQLWEGLPPNYQFKVRRFYGDIEGTDKQVTIDQFHKGDVSVVLATKAFGMGVDIDDIMEVYHHAPSGSLSDYVQEIGRVARKAELKGTASTDFCIKDLKYTRILYGLSSIRQYQAKYALQKINDLYRKSNAKQMLVSVEDFGFIFSDQSGESSELERKVKSALLCIEKDLLQKINGRYNVLVVRPKALFSTVFACITDDNSSEFLAEYGDCCTNVQDKCHNSRAQSGQLKTAISDAGDIYEIQLDKIWQKYFGEQSFPQVKRNFFNQKLFPGGDDKQPHPRYKLDISLGDNPFNTKKLLEECFSNLEETFDHFKDQTFTGDQLRASLSTKFKSEAKARRITNLLTNMYSSMPSSQNGPTGIPFGTFLISRTSKDSNTESFQISNSNFRAVKTYVLKNFVSMFAGSQREYTKFIRPGATEGEIAIKIAYLLESLLLGNYEIAGGKLSQIFIRINDPYKLREFAEDAGYTNSILQAVEQRHKRSIKQMEDFFNGKGFKSNEQRWEFIENYFLGNLPDENLNS